MELLTEPPKVMQKACRMASPMELRKETLKEHRKASVKARRMGTLRGHSKVTPMEPPKDQKMELMMVM